MNDPIPPPSDSPRFAAIDTEDIRSLLRAEKDAHLRLAADFENFKKRTRRDSEQRAAVEKDSLIHDLLPILDNLERALAVAQTSSPAQLHQGVEMTLQLLGRLLLTHGVEPLEVLGQPFDPHRQEAVASGYDPTQPDSSVLEVVQRGYGKGGQVFRPARVVVNNLDPVPGANRAG